MGTMKFLTVHRDPSGLRLSSSADLIGLVSFSTIPSCTFDPSWSATPYVVVHLTRSIGAAVPFVFVFVPVFYLFCGLAVVGITINELHFRAAALRSTCQPYVGNSPSINICDDLTQVLKSRAALVIKSPSRLRCILNFFGMSAKKYVPACWPSLGTF